MTAVLYGFYSYVSLVLCIVEYCLMGKIKSSIDDLGVLIVKYAQLDKGQCIDQKYSWTIYLLVDLKIVYIITFAFITITNLISSTANGEAISDANSMARFNVTLSPALRNVEVKYINDAVLWNCRSQSVNSHYYRFLYWMLVTALSAALLGFLVVKAIGLISVNCTCKTCCPCAYIEHGLTKLWHIAILEYRAEHSNMKTTIQNSGNDQQLQSDNDPQRHNVTQAAIENGNELADVSITTEPHLHSNNHRSLLQGTPNNETVASNIIMKANTDDPELKVYQALLDQDVQSDILKGLGFCSWFANFCRQIIPGILLCLSVAMMGLSFLSYDLHPLACIVVPAEDFIQYNATTKSVILEFSHHLKDFQITAGWIVLGLTISFLILVGLFYRVSIKVVNDIKSKVELRINEKIRKL